MINENIGIIAGDGDLPKVLIEKINDPFVVGIEGFFETAGVKVDYINESLENFGKILEYFRKNNVTKVVMAGGVAVIRVGGATEVEVKERKDRVDDAMHATRAAVQEGIVPGGGVALVKSVSALDGLTAENGDQEVGIRIIRKALEAPARQIANNAGADGSVIVGKLLETKEAAVGYNAQSGEFTDLIKAGVIDPTKVVRSSLQNAASVAGLLITTEAMVAEKDDPKAAAGGAPDMGGMGGMGGMGF